MTAAQRAASTGPSRFQVDAGSIAQRVAELEDTVARLTAENAALRQRLADVDGGSAASNGWPQDWRLSRSEGKLLAALAAVPVCSAAVAMTAMYGAQPEAWRGHGTMSTLLFRLRRKLAPFGVRILSVHGDGHAIAPESRAIVEAARVQLQ